MGDNGFEMSLSAQVPDTIRQHLRTWIDNWLQRNRLSVCDVGSWAIHPGGPKILQASQDALELDDAMMQPSRSILSDFGNMSSPTVLFILDRLRQQHADLPCVVLGFGPGLTIEAALIR
ncbi:3-oxoacyl-[acyl-carrier-protein] synthase III C-terminal domain-containing protein [Planctomycetota bacterium]